MASSRKKAILRYLTREWAAGYIAASDLGEADSGASPSALAPTAISMLDLAGNAATVPLARLKWICFVRDFNSGDLQQPERLLQKSFAGRPRHAGLWLRLRLPDGDLLEGVAPNDLSLLDPAGLFLIPPDTRSNTQRVFVPRSSVVELTVLSVIGNGLPRRKPPASARVAEQDDLFLRNDISG